MKRLIVHITDIVEKIDLKIFEDENGNKVNFIFEINDTRDNSTSIFKVEEKVAAIIYEGLNNVFTEVDETDEQSQTKNSLTILQEFFQTLQNKDKEHFGLNEDEE